jgi:hypothetical protein
VQLLLSAAFYPYKPPAAAGGFYFINHSQPAPNGIQYLAPSPTSAANLEPLFSHKESSNIPAHSKSIRLHTPPLLMHLFPPTQLPNTSLSIASTDAVGSSKPRGYVLPILWDLIEPDVKRKGQLLLPW